jgi:hypothetical protein
MLSEHEEQVLRRIARENMPLPRQQAPTNTNPGPSTANYIAEQMRRCKPAADTDPNLDYAVISILTRAGVLKKGDKLTQFYARTGIGPSRLRLMSAAEIRRAVELADERNLADPVQEPRTISVREKENNEERK